MTTSPTTRPHRARTVASVVLALVSVLSGIIAISVYAPMDDPFEPDAQLLVASFGLVAAVLSACVALVPFRRGERWAWAAMWVWPAFFAWHVAALGTVVPDAVLGVVCLVALLAARPRGRSTTTPAMQQEHAPVTR